MSTFLAVVFMWLLTFMITGQWWVGPLVFLILCGYVICDQWKMRQRIAIGKERQRIHREKQMRTGFTATAALLPPMKPRGLSELTDEAIRMLCCPN